MAASKEPDYVIAHRILTELLIRHQMQRSKLQSLLGITENFESAVEILWHKANRDR
jgi:hypothetical protein